jgi:hypothetical protein
MNQLVGSEYSVFRTDFVARLQSDKGKLYSPTPLVELKKSSDNLTLSVSTPVSRPELRSTLQRLESKMDMLLAQRTPSGKGILYYPFFEAELEPRQGNYTLLWPDSLDIKVSCTGDGQEQTLLLYGEESGPKLPDQELQFTVTDTQRSVLIVGRLNQDKVSFQLPREMAGPYLFQYSGGVTR